jgi:DNA replication protein DnaC
MTEAPKILLAHHLKTLKLPTFLREYDKLARQCAAEGLDHVGFLTRLVELELIDRERRMVERRIKAAKFPVTKSLDSFDFKAIPKLNKMHVLELARCEWIDRRENVIALGPSGTGKTHVALGLGLAACQKGMSVGFTTAAALVNELMEARDERRLLRFQKQMAGHCKGRMKYPRKCRAKIPHFRDLRSAGFRHGRLHFSAVGRVVLAAAAG